MNYQKLLSRFYTVEPSSQETPKCLQESSKATEDSDEFPYHQQNEDVSLYAEIETTETTWYQAHDEFASPVEEPIGAEHVRWFYKAPDEKIWCEFNGYDSLTIENTYRESKRNENGEDFVRIDKVLPDANGVPENVHYSLNLSKASKDAAADSPAKRIKKDSVPSASENDHKSNPKSKDDCSNGENKITVRGGMYEIDLSRMLCESIYWPGEQYVITRGLYFYDGSWQPLEGIYGEILEQEHLRLFSRKNEEVADKPPIQPGGAIHSHHFPEFHVEWLSSSDIYLYWGGAPRQLVRSVTQKLGFYQSTGYRLKRGYRTIATDAERPPEITHVVFVIHGIGQKMDSGRIIRNTNALRASCDWLRSQYLDRGGTENRGRAELFPARWRAGERGDAAELLAATAPLGAPALRRAINDAAMDVMYYTSPVYGKQVQDDLMNELNRLYTMFMSRNPDYKGQFSAVAHSLGCVIIYDIITGYQMGCERCTNADGEVHDSSNKLLFQLQQLFCLGSPLGVFLSLRQPIMGKPRVLPPGFSTRLFNIFHLSDPVAYRLEPLFASWLSKHPPLVIQAHYTAPLTSPSTQASPAKGPWKIWSYVKHPWQRSETGSPIMNSSVAQNGSECSPKKVVSSSDNDGGPVTVKEEGGDLYQNDTNYELCGNGLDDSYKDKSEDVPPVDCSVTSQASSSPEEILPYRIDYTLRDTFITNNYIWAITSHTTYWNNYDVAYFILSHLLPDMNDSEEVQSVSF